MTTTYEFEYPSFQQVSDDVRARHLSFKNSLVGFPNEINPRIYGATEDNPGFYINPRNFYPRQALYFIMLQTHLSLNSIKERSELIVPITNRVKNDWKHFKKAAERADFLVSDYIDHLRERIEGKSKKNGYFEDKEREITRAYIDIEIGIKSRLPESERDIRVLSRRSGFQKFRLEEKAEEFKKAKKEFLEELSKLERFRREELFSV